MISLAELRALVGLSVPQLAGRMGATADAVRQVESLEPELLTVVEIVAYCRALGLRVVITAQGGQVRRRRVLLDTQA